VLAVAITMLLYWLAHSYADYAGERAETREQVSLAGITRILIHELWILGGAIPPLLVVLISWAAGATLKDAVGYAVWTAAAIITGTELVIGLRNELSGRALIVQTAWGAILGVLVIALRYVLKH
jgi:hypothetical protein